VSGVMLGTAATIMIVWNVSIATSLTALLGRTFSRLLPAVKTAVAYPLASKGRTGMTIAMFSMIVFSLVVMSTINYNMSALFSGDEAAAGWDIAAAHAPTNTIDDFEQALAANGADTSPIVAVGKVE